MTRRRTLQQQGMTIIELMVTMAIVAILAGVSAPSMRDMLLSWRMTSQTNDFISNFAMARGQAAALGTTVTVCASSDGASCTGTWSQGHIIFTDADADATVDGGTDRILRVASALSSGTTLVVSNLSTAGRLQFRPTGMVSGVTGSGATFALCDGRTGPYGRTITVQLTGRAASVTVTC